MGIAQCLEIEQARATAIHNVITLLAEMQSRTYDADNGNYQTEEYGRCHDLIGGDLLLRMNFLYMMPR